MLLALLVLWLFQFESPEFALSTEVFLVGALLSWLFPERFRLIAITVVSFLGVFLLFSVEISLVVVLLSVASVALLRSSLSNGSKVLGMLTLGACVFMWRQNWAESKIAFVVVPVFGSIFALRFISYLRETANNPQWRSWSQSLAYFSILPNVVMWFFPLIDYRRFIEGASGPRNRELLQKSAQSVFEGLIQLFLYRVLQATCDIPLQYVSSKGELVQYFLITYLHYIRISGIFHLVIGLVGLYGVELPRSHNFYFFANNSRDLFRRINTYWKDAMVKFVYSPILSRLEHYDKRISLAISTVSVIAASLLLHGFFYLWPRGVFELKFEDVFFWGAMGVWLVSDIFIINKNTKDSQQKKSTMHRFFLLAFQISTTFFILSILWGVWNSGSINDLVALVILSEWRGAQDVWPLLCYPLIGLSGAVYFLWKDREKPADSLSAKTNSFHNWFRLGALSALCLMTTSTFQNLLPLETRSLVKNIADPMFQSEYEGEKRSYDYYEGFKTSALAPVDEDELPIEKQPIYEPLSDYRRRQFRPMANHIFMGHRFVTNRWGMPCSKDFSLEKPKNVLRIAVMGASHAISYGIAADNDWPRQAEAILNSSGFANIEILNFSMIAYPSMVMPHVFLERVAQFNPDIVVHVGGFREYWVTGYVAGLALRNGLSIPFPELFPILGVENSESFLAKHYFTNASFEKQKALFEWGQKKLAQVVKQKDSKIGLMYFMTPGIFESSKKELAFARWNEQHIMKTARDAGFNVYDHTQLFAGRSLREVTLADDVNHFNHFSQVGHNILAKQFAANIKDFISIWKNQN